MLRPLGELFDQQDYPNLLVGLNAPDDAAVWKMDEKRGLVVTTDFFTPVVDDALDYGRIAAANSLSDIYAMGGRPFLALNIAALPTGLDPEISSQILRGGAEIAKKAGVVIAGGHTVQDEEPKYGLVVVGWVDLEKIFTKSAARPGDLLYMTKPLGFGSITTALKQQKAEADDVAEAVEWMKTLNDTACEAGQKAGVHGATDITGYALIGHASEMAAASHVALEFEVCNIPVLPTARKYAEQMIFPGGAHDNKQYYGPRVQMAYPLGDSEMMIFFDPQTSGGLLLAVPPKNAAVFETEMRHSGGAFWLVGSVVEGQGVRLK